MKWRLAKKILTDGTRYSDDLFSRAFGRLLKRKRAFVRGLIGYRPKMTWRNWSMQYTPIPKDDFLQKLEEAAKRTTFNRECGL